jgi:death-on-curing protein
MNVLTKEMILKFHRALIDEHGGSSEIRDEGLLDSALATPFQTFGGYSLFPTVREKAVRLGYGIISNHPFLDGNKRTGAHSMLVMLSINGIELKHTQRELWEMIQKVAEGKADYDELLKWVLTHEKI